MVATVGAFMVAALLLAGLAASLARERRLRRRAEDHVAWLETRVAEAAENAAAAILAGRGVDLPPRREPQRSRHLRSVQGVLWPAALAAAWEAARRHPQRVGAALASTVAAGLIALPLLAPGDPQPDRPEPPAAVAPLPAEVQPPPARVPVTEPEQPDPDPEPAGGGEAGGPAPAEVVEMEEVAVVAPEPEPEPAGAVPPAQPAPVPEPVPEPEPAPEPSPIPELPLPPRDPLPEPEPEPPPEDDDDGLVCADLELLTLAELRLCLP